MAGEAGGEKPKSKTQEYEAPNYSAIESVDLINVAQTLTTKAETGRLYSFLVGRLSQEDRTDRDMTLAALQAVIAQEESFTKFPERNNDMVFEGTNRGIKALPRAEVDKAFTEMTGVSKEQFGPDEGHTNS